MRKTFVPELRDPEARKALVEAVAALLDRWQLGDDDRVVLLGLSNRVELAGYLQGEREAADPDLLARIGHLLAIDRALRKKYPYRPGRRDQWIKTPDPGLANRSPLAVVRALGMEGLHAIRDRAETGRSRYTGA